jgi:hypothetical protein
LAGKITDKELRLRALKLTNAYEQPSLILRKIADGDQLVDIINIYQHENWPHEKVYCSECNGHHHRDGFTAFVLTSTGALIRMLLGSDCGAEAFHETWKVAKRRMMDLHDRQWELGRLDRLDIIQNNLKSSLEVWRSKVPAVIGRKSAFALKLGELASRLEEAELVHGGRFFVHRLMTLKNGEKHSETQILDRIRGSDLFKPFNMMGAIERAQLSLDQMAKAIVISDSLTTKVLRKRRKAFEETFDDLHVVAVMYAGAQEFFNAETFAKVVDWTNRYAVTEKRYSWNGKAIEEKNGWNEFDLPRPFPDLGDEPLDLIAEYRRAD